MTDHGRPLSTVLPHSDDDRLLTQVREILAEVLEAGCLPEHAQGRLRALIAEHAEHPERALFEHLQAVRRDGHGELVAS